MSVLVDKYRRFRMGYPPTFKFCSSTVHHTVYVCRDSYLLVLGGGVLVYQGFYFLKGSWGDFFFDKRGLDGGREKIFLDIS